jgi:uncharacterized membrane protein
VSTLLLFLAAFLASAVEMVEALTIVLAVGLSRDWRSSLWGVAAALVALAAIVAVLGPALTAVPIGALRLVVGWLLLVFGLQWLRKAILRASGLRELHDEDAIYAGEVAAARDAAPAPGNGRVDGYALVLSFKGVLLEGLEVAFIVLAFGSSHGADGILLASAAATLALLLVVVAGAVARRPLSRVPENLMKFAVGVMLTSYGVFWGAEGTGATWPGGELALAGVVMFVLVLAIGLVAILRSLPGAPGAPERA